MTTRCSRKPTRSALRDLARCDAALQQLLGEGTYWVRPPYGLISQAELSAIHTPLLHWSVDTRDWDLRDADKVLDIILREADDGDVILLHDCYAASVEAALRAIDRLQAWGVRFVTVEELFRIKGVDVQDGVLYKCPGATHPRRDNTIYIYIIMEMPVRRDVSKRDKRLAFAFDRHYK